MNSYIGTSLLGVMLLAGCDSSPVESRFPTFQEFIAVDSLSWEDEAGLEKQIELTKRLSFRNEEIEEMFQSSDVEDLVVVYLQAHFDDPRRVGALEKAVALDRDNRLVAMLLVSHCSYPSATEKFDYCDQDVFEALLNLDPDNMVSHYIVAGYSNLNGERDSALGHLRRGNSSVRYDIYSSEYFNLLVNKAIAYGFPLFVAHANALGSFSTTMHTKPWFDMCTSDLPEPHQLIYTECVKMGANIESNAKTILEKSLGIGLQIRGLEAQGGTESVIAVVEERRNRMLGITDRLNELPNKYLSEEMDAEFFTDLLEIGEIAAFENLITKVKRAIENDT